MPDHIHALWMGTNSATDLRLANRWLRRELNEELKSRGFCLQSQAYDRVLRESERERYAFENLVNYVLENPERSQVNSKDSFVGMVVPGYPRLSHSLRNCLDDWEMFWKTYHRLREDS